MPLRDIKLELNDFFCEMYKRVTQKAGEYDRPTKVSWHIWAGKPYGVDYFLTKAEEDIEKFRNSGDTQDLVDAANRLVMAKATWEYKQNSV